VFDHLVGASVILSYRLLNNTAVPPCSFRVSTIFALRPRR
jgi:hypothetical protein